MRDCGSRGTSAHCTVMSLKGLKNLQRLISFKSLKSLKRVKSLISLKVGKEGNALQSALESFTRCFYDDLVYIPFIHKKWTTLSGFLHKDCCTKICIFHNNNNKRTQWPPGSAQTKYFEQIFYVPIFLKNLSSEDSKSAFKNTVWPKKSAT